jgi:hypothetical protein
MKSFLSILISGVIVAAFIAGFFYGSFKPAAAVPQQLTLEKILSIKELHLVKHTYNDLFFLHKNNDSNKAIRAIVQVPVVVTAYLDLKEIQIIKQHDSIRQIVLPHAQMNEPHYEVHKMVIRETRSFHLHAGKDLYPLVGNYLQAAIANRIDTVRHMAVTNRVLAQAEEEGKEYIISLLHELGRSDVVVRFKDEVPKSLSNPVQSIHSVQVSARQRNQLIESIPFGFLPL